MLRRILRAILTALSWSFLIAIPLQVYFAGLGVFRVSLDFTSGRSAPTYYSTHITFGYILGLIALAMLILAPIAGFKRRTIGWAGLLFLLNLVQTFLLWTGGGAVQALHPPNGILIFAAAFLMARSATQEYRQAIQDMAEREADGSVPRKSAEAQGMNI